jgi:hypothetical protein
MAEVELSVLSGQCLDRRMGDRAVLEHELAAWEARATVDWRFTTARTKLNRLYPPVSQWS